MESLRLSVVVVTYTLPQKGRFRNFFAFYSVFKVRNIGLETKGISRADKESLSMALQEG